MANSRYSSPHHNRDLRLRPLAFFFMYGAHVLQGPASGREGLVGTQSGDSILLEGVSRHHAGEYQCSAHNGVGSLAIADLSLTVLCKYNIHLGWAYPATMPGSTSAPPTTVWAPSPLLISPSQSYVSTIFPSGGRILPPFRGVPVLHPQEGWLVV